MDNLLKFVADLTAAQVSFEMTFADRQGHRDAFVCIHWERGNPSPDVCTYGAIPLASGSKIDPAWGLSEHLYEHYFFRL